MNNGWFYLSGVSKVGPHGLLSCRFPTHPGSNAPDLNKWVQVPLKFCTKSHYVNSGVWKPAGLGPSRTAAGDPCMRLFAWKLLSTNVVYVSLVYFYRKQIYLHQALEMAQKHGKRFWLWLHIMSENVLLCECQHYKWRFPMKRDEHRLKGCPLFMSPQRLFSSPSPKITS